jgi:hypothetical protein
MSTNLGTVTPSEALSTSSETSIMTSSHHPILSNNLSDLHDITHPSVKLDSLPSHATPDDPLVAQAHASGSTTGTRPDNPPTSPSTATSQHSHHDITKPASIISAAEAFEPGQDPEPHQQSLEGILAMIESAVYPHCVAESSPAGSQDPPCTVSPRLKGSEPAKDQKAEGIAEAGEEVIVSAELTSEQVDARKEVLDAQPDITPVLSRGDFPIRAMSCAGDGDDDAKEASEDTVANQDNTLGQESSEEPIATANREPSTSNLSPNPTLIENQKDGDPKSSSNQGVATTPSSSPAPPIPSTSAITEVQPFQEDLIELIDNADLIQEHHSSLSRKEGPTTPSSSTGSPIGSSSRRIEVQPIQVDKLVRIDDTNLTDNSDKHHSQASQEAFELIACRKAPMGAASPSFSQSFLTLTSEADKVAGAEESVACESAILLEQTEESAILQDPTIGDALIDSTTSMCCLLFPSEHNELTRNRYRAFSWSSTSAIKRRDYSRSFGRD